MDFSISLCIYISDMYRVGLFIYPKDDGFEVLGLILLCPNIYEL
jgi:hypothetical protein